MQIAPHRVPLLVFLLVRADAPLTAAPDLVPAVQLSAGGGSFVAAAGDVAEIGEGWYSVRLSEAETGTLGTLIVRATAAGALEWRDIHQVVEAAAVDLDVLAARVLERMVGQPYMLKLPVTLGPG